MKKNVLRLAAIVIAALLCSPAGLAQFFPPSSMQDMMCPQNQTNLKAFNLVGLNANVPDQRDDLLNRLATGTWIVYDGRSPNSVGFVWKFGHGEWRRGDTNILLGMEDVTRTMAPGHRGHIANFRQTYRGEFYIPSPPPPWWNVETHGIWHLRPIHTVLPPNITIFSLAQFSRAVTTQDSEFEMGGRKHSFARGTPFILIRGESVNLALSGIQNSITISLFPLEQGEWVGRLQREVAAAGHWAPAQNERTTVHLYPLTPFQQQPEDSDVIDIEYEIVPQGQVPATTPGRGMMPPPGGTPTLSQCSCEAGRCRICGGTGNANSASGIAARAPTYGMPRDTSFRPCPGSSCNNGRCTICNGRGFR